MRDTVGKSGFQGRTCGGSSGGAAHAKKRGPNYAAGDHWSNTGNQQAGCRRTK